MLREMQHDGSLVHETSEGMEYFIRAVSVLF